MSPATIALDAGLATLLMAILPWCGGSPGWRFGHRLIVGAGFFVGALAINAVGPLPFHFQWSDVLLWMSWAAVGSVDWHDRIVPHRLVAASLITGVLSSWSSGAPIWHRALCALTMAAMLSMVRWLSGRALGMGDVKFSLSLGVSLGWTKALMALSLAIWGAGLWALAILWFKRSRGSSLAFAPFMASFGLVALCLPLKLGPG